VIIEMKNNIKYCWVIEEKKLLLTADCEKTSPSVYKNKYKKEDEQIFLH
jgi:hypothetical protein